MQDIRKYRVFMASPSDVGEERNAVRNACESLNRDVLIQDRNIMLEHVGWEDAVPAAGRPQATINLMQEGCDIFVCILHKKYGTPTGDAESGTEEEFLNAYDSWKDIQKPKILFYFKEVKISSAADFNDPQLGKVFELKEKIEKNEMLLYGSFPDSEQFKRKIVDDLKKVILELCREEKQDHGTSDKAVKPAVQAIVPENYKNWVNDKTSYMDIEYLSSNSSAITVKLPEIFQQLYSDDPDRKENPEHAEDRGQMKVRGEIKSSVEIEAIAAKGETLLVSGMAGSGKTTLAKHMARTIVNNDSLFFETGLLPVLIYFKDIKAYEYKGRIPNAEEAEKLITWYCDCFFSSFIDLERINAFCEKGRAVFILDGLDEADPGARDFAVSCFADFRLKYKGIKVILLGRPHGVKGEAKQRFGSRFASVHDLTPEQAEGFIDNWFDHIYLDGISTGQDLAARMKGEIRSRQDIDDLKKNPLLLTAMCILYNDLKVLPDQRADLYNNFVDRLFSKFGSEKVRVNNFMMEMAHDMFKQGERGIDQKEAVKILKKHFSLSEPDNTYEDLFNRIEPATGLLKREAGRYKFLHLTFQEFLTAKYMIDSIEDSSFDAISPYISNERYKEVVELFIGFLSIRNSNAADSIIRKILEQDPMNPGGYNHILAAHSLLDIHQDNRKKEVCSFAMDKMLTLIRSAQSPQVLLEAGEAMGRLGYDKGYDVFVPVKGGVYDLDGLGKVELEGFEISKFPVTNLWYERFINAGGYENREFWTEQGLQWLGKKDATEPGRWRDRTYNCPNSPVVGVCWYEAAAFCKWLEKSYDQGFQYYLPSETQWQAAAAGKHKREYPWGDSIDKLKCNYLDTELGRPSPVGIFLQGKTKQGVYDLSGNVYEWTRTDFDQKKELKDCFFDIEHIVLRGGSSFDHGETCRCAVRDYDEPDLRSKEVGFRCARIKV